MKKLLIIPIAALMLSGCATFFTPQRCEDALRAADSIEQITAILIVRGIEPERAAKLAELVRQGRMAIEAACEASRAAD